MMHPFHYVAADSSCSLCSFQSIYLPLSVSRCKDTPRDAFVDVVTTFMG